MKVRVAVVGAGKFAGFHARKYASIDNVIVIAIVDKSLEAARRLAEQYSCEALTDIDDVVGRIDAATVATPASTHAQIAIPLLRAGIHVYIEKPLATSIEDGRAILQAAKQGGALVQCGFQERYILKRLHLTEQPPQRIECRRLSPWSGRGGDVDVALDLMIHDVDMVLQLAGAQVSSYSAHRGKDELSAVLRVGHCTAHLHASRKAAQTERTMLLVYEDGTVWIDFLAGKIHDSRPINIKAKFGDLLGQDHARYDPLGLAVSDFVNCVRTGEQPFITGESGMQALTATLALLGQTETQSTQNIPLFNVKTAAAKHRADIEHRIAKVLDHGQYIGGPEVSELESRLARFTGAKYCLTVSSGTAALSIAIMGEGLTREDAVLVPALTYNATCNAVLAAGATPVLVDVDPETCNISARTVKSALAAISGLRPAVLCAVDLYGKPAPYDELNELANEYGMVVLADAAQSFGGSYKARRVGNLADMTATSFYPSKTLGGLGDGGALFTNDEDRYQTWQSIRWHGTDAAKSESVRVGLNGRMSTMQCAMLLSKFKSFEEEILLRSHVAEQYLEQLSSMVRSQRRSIHEEHANGLFTIILSSSAQRDDLARALKEAGIGSGVYYPLPLHRHKAFAGYVLEKQDFPNAEWLAQRVLSLPMSPFMTRSQVASVCQVVKSVVRTADASAVVAARL